MRAALVGLFGCVLLAACSGAEVDANPATTTAVAVTTTTVTTSSTTTVPTTTTTVIGAGLLDGKLMAAWNRGDHEAFWAFFADGATWDGQRHDSRDVLEHFEYMVAIGFRPILSDCEYSSETHAICRTTFVDDVLEIADLEVQIVGDYWFDKGGLITSYSVSGFNTAEADRFYGVFNPWLETTYPDLAVQWNEPQGEYPNAAVCGSVIAAAAEFLESHPEHRAGADPVIPAPSFSGSIDGVDVFNAGDRQMDLVSWALERFSASGLLMPPVTAVRFPPTEQCHRGVSGSTVHSDEGSSIDVCVASEDLSDDDGFPCRARRTILHELGHVWNAHVATEATRQDFLKMRGLDEWRADVWQESGSEQAAEIIMWGLLDQSVKPRVPDTACVALHTAFATLTGIPATERTSDCTDE